MFIFYKQPFFCYYLKFVIQNFEKKKKKKFGVVYYTELLLLKKIKIQCLVIVFYIAYIIMKEKNNIHCYTKLIYVKKI
jgi:hypothetical protein